MDPPQKVESSHQLLSAPPSIPVAVSVGAHGGGPLADLHLLGRDLHPDCPMVGAPLPDENVFQCSRPTAETPQERGWKLGNGLGATGVELNKEGNAKGALSHTQRQCGRGSTLRHKRIAQNLRPGFNPAPISSTVEFFFGSSWVQILQADGSRRPGGGPHGWSQCGEPRGQFS